MPMRLNPASRRPMRPFCAASIGLNDTPLLEALREKNYPRAYQILKWMDNRPMEGETASRCLAEALSCTANLFAAVLDACAPDEYVAQTQWKLNNVSAFANLQGTILTLAAGMNLVEHMKLLLERGYSSGGASPRNRPGSLQSSCRPRTGSRRCGS